MHWLQFVDNDDNEFRSRTFGGATDAILDVGFSFGTDVVLDVGCSIGTGVVATDFSVTFETDVMVTTVLHVLHVLYDVLLQLVSNTITIQASM